MSRRSGGGYVPHFATCRVCREGGPASGLVKYSVRHYAHPECAMVKWGAAFFDRLTPWQVARFPYMVAMRHGHARALELRAAPEPAAGAGGA